MHRYSQQYDYDSVPGLWINFRFPGQTVIRVGIDDALSILYYYGWRDKQAILRSQDVLMIFVFIKWTGVLCEDEKFTNRKAVLERQGI